MVGVGNLNTFSKSTRELYHSLRSDVIGIHYRLRVLRQLFTSKETVDLLNKAAIRFFTTLKWDLFDIIAIAISRLTDPAKSSKRYHNASLQQLIDNLDPNTHTQLILSLTGILAQIKAKSPRIENWRKKWAAHRDLEVLQGQAPKPAVSLPEIDEVLALIGKFMNEFERVFQDPRVEINLYGKTVPEVEEVVESERLKIGPPSPYENMLFQDDGNTIINLIKGAIYPQ